MTLRNLAQHFWIRLCGIWIQSHHCAARITLENAQLYMLTNAHALANQRIFTEAFRVAQIQIDVRTKATRVDVGAQLSTKLDRCRQSAKPLSERISADGAD